LYILVSFLVPGSQLHSLFNAFEDCLEGSGTGGPEGVLEPLIPGLEGLHPRL